MFSKLKDQEKESKQHNEGFENRFEDFKQYLFEMKSSLMVLQAATQNESNPPELRDIDNAIEILLKGFDFIIDRAMAIENET